MNKFSKMEMRYVRHSVIKWMNLSHGMLLPACAHPGAGILELG